MRMLTKANDLPIFLYHSTVGHMTLVQVIKCMYSDADNDSLYGNERLPNMI